MAIEALAMTLLLVAAAFPIVFDWIERRIRGRKKKNVA
jgi:hypothetical protein